MKKFIKKLFVLVCVLVLLSCEKKNTDFTEYELITTDILYTSAGRFRKGIAVVCSGTYWYLIDRMNKRISAAYSDPIYYLDETHYVVYKIKSNNVSMEIIDNTGKKISKINTNMDKNKGTWDKLIVGDTENSNGLFVFSKCENLKTTFGYCDIYGNTIIDPIYDFVTPFNEGYAYVEYNGKSKYIDTKGFQLGTMLGNAQMGTVIGNIHLVSVLSDSRFDLNSIFKLKEKIFNEGMGPLYINGEIVFINKTGKVVLETHCQVITGSFSEGLCGVYDKNKKWHVINNAGKEISKVHHDAMLVGVDCFNLTYSDRELVHGAGFNEGLAVVSVYDNDKTYEGYIDKTGKEVIPCKYKECGRFEKGIALVIDTDGLYYYINKKGEKLTSGHGNALPIDAESGMAVVIGNKDGRIKFLKFK